MTKNIELRQLTIADKTAEQRRALAQRVQQLVRMDFEAIGVPTDAARSFADEDDQTKVDRQIERLQRSSAKGTRYLGVYAAGMSHLSPEAMDGVIKLGPWTEGDEEPFEKARSRQERARRFGRPTEGQSEGLHVMAVRRDLVRASLQAVWGEVTPHQSLKAAVHLDDRELQTAFTQLGAPTDGPIGQITLGNYTANYQLRELPSLDK